MRAMGGGVCGWGRIAVLWRLMSQSPRSFGAAAAIRTALARFQRSTERICRANGLTADQYTLLLLVKGADGSTTTVGSLASRLALAHNTIVERINRAVAAGLLVRDHAPDDGRVSLVRLTAEGERRLIAAYRALGADADRLVDAIIASEVGAALAGEAGRPTPDAPPRLTADVGDTPSEGPPLA